MRSILQSPQIGLRYHLAKDNLRLQDEQTTTPPMADRPSSSAKNAIARSMSRYKGTRQLNPRNGPPVNNPLPSNQSSSSFHHGLPMSPILRPQEEPVPKVPLVQSGNETRAPLRHGPQPHVETPLHHEPHPHVESQQLQSRKGGSGTKPLVNAHQRPLAHIEEPIRRREQRLEGVKKLTHDPQSPGLANENRGYGPSPKPKKSFAERMADHINKYQSSGRPNNKADLKRMISNPIIMASGGETTVPSFDAPISAVNAGERRVIVKCKDSLISLPVTPFTTPEDIIYAAALEKPNLINVHSSVLLESFNKVGLERPLRKYEHVRDVLNSWDNDSQNYLVVVPSPTDGKDDDLDVKTVSRKQPAETSVYLYHSQKPGHWEKRLVTLRSDGQVVVKKNDKDPVNICHLTDFDIYVPTPRQKSKKIKPPKKVCFAVKSQQKSSMFMSTANFVHFFSTNDKATAASWYKAVQGWRSWYLVTMMGEGREAVRSRINGAGASPKKVESTTGNRNGANHQAISSVESTSRSANSIGSESICAQGHAGGVAKPRGKPNGVSTTGNTTKNKIGPPLSFPKNLMRETTLEIPHVQIPLPGQGSQSDSSPAEPFASTGLLGRSYSHRQTAQRGGTKDSGHGPGHALAIMATQVKEENTAIKRASSQRQKAKPLIDLTPQFQEPPQHLKKGRGLIPQQIPAGGLVNIATSPEVAIPIPPTKTWRRPTGGNGVS